MIGFKTVEEGLATKFTPEALDAIKTIPVVYGRLYVPFVTGVNFWSDLGGVLLFNGTGRQVIFSRHHMESRTALTSLIHEYMHHIDDLDREGVIDLINHSEFRCALLQMRSDPKYKGNYENIIDCSDWFITNWFGVGDLSEEIAYTASWLATEGGPEYMWKVFRKILTRPTTGTRVAHK